LFTENVQFLYRAFERLRVFLFLFRSSHHREGLIRRCISPEVAIALLSPIPKYVTGVDRDGREVRVRTVIIGTYLLGTIRFVTIFVLVMAAIILWFS
jgi:hypothetical protein